MSDPVPSAPSRPAPPQMVARLDPPEAVQEAVAAALRACHDWQPVPLPPPGPDAVPVPVSVSAGTVEAGICDLLDDWPHHADAAAYMQVGLGVSISLATAFLLLMLRRGLRVFGRTRTGWWLRDTLREPWRDVQVIALGALLGCFAGLLLTDLLRRIGLDLPGTSAVLCLVAGVAGTIGMVRLRRSQQRQDALRWQR